MNPLQQCIRNHIQISNEELYEITSVFKTRILTKNQYLLKAGERCNEMAFIESGYVRMYDVRDGKEVTIWIGGSDSFITSLSSFIFGTINHWNIQAVTDCTMQILKKKDHLHLLQKFSKWLEFDNLLLARAYALLENSMMQQLHTTAKKRYEILMESNPAIFNHVPLQYIASSMGITAETLSRLRKNASDSLS